MHRIVLAARVIAAAAIGACLPLAFAPFDWHGLTVPALALLFLLGAGTGARRAALIGFAFGLGEFGYGVHWIYTALHTFGATPAGLGVALDIMLCCFLAIYPALILAAGEIFDLWRSRSGWIAIPGLWLFGELLRRSLFWGGFPWFSLGYSALDTPLIRLAPIFGTYGISAVLVWLSYALYRVIATRGISQRIAIAALILPLSMLFLLPKPESWTQPQGEPLSIAMIQAGVPMDQKYDRGTLDSQMANYRSLTLKNLDAQLIVWPESALPIPLDELGPGYLDDLNQILRAHDTSLLFGAIITEPPDAEHPKIYASAVATGVSTGRYDKRHLVPFGEFFPVPDFMRPLMNLLGTPYDNITRGAAVQPNMTLGQHQVDVSICYEDVYGAEFRSNARDADYLINLTNDAWYGRTNAAIQHLAIARMRALEYGRDMVRSTSTGFSAFIGADGSLRSRSGMFTLETLRGRVQPRSGSTPFDRWGDWPLWGFGVLSLVLAVVSRAGRRRT